MSKRESVQRRSVVRSLARRLLKGWLSNSSAKSELRAGRPIRFEPLEGRQLMAGDTFNSLYPTSSLDDDRDFLNANTPSMNVGSLVGEGEAQDDLVAFAKALRDAGVQFFGAAWCPFCTEQKNLFQDGYKYLPFVEVTNPDRTPNSIGTSENITTYPTWKFQNGQKVTGVQTLAQLSTLSGIAIPKSSTPSFDTIGPQTVLVGSPLHVPVDAYDPNGNPLTITVTSSNPSLVTAQVLSGSRSVEMVTEGYGKMVYELFEQEASRATSRFIQLVQSGFYNKSGANQIIFHRVVDNFVIQAGDPTGTGSGGSTLGDFDDVFDVDLQHNRTGVLSYAKSSDDTNDSQFFVTEGPQRNLDFNHSIFGQLVEYDANREAISEVPVGTNSKPTTNVVISSMNIFEDTENGLIRLKAASNQTGTATITVTVTDTEGNSTQQTFNVTVAADNRNSAPFLNDVTVPAAVAGQPVSFQLTSQDVEGDAVFYDASVATGSQYGVTVNNTTGLVTVTPNSGFTGPMTVTVGVRAATTADTVDTFDTQRITISQAPAAPTGIDLSATSDTGTSNTDNITNAGTMTFVVSGTVSGATVELKIGTTVVGTAVASGTSTTITTSNISALGAGTRSIVATQTVNSQTSANSPAFSLVFDNTSPVAIATDAIPSTANVGTALNVNLSHAEEGTGLVYSLQNAPTGMTIVAGTGVLQWTPAAGQTGAQTFNLLLTDTAGNVRTQAFTINVNEAAQGGFTLQLVDTNNAPITSVSVGQTFKVQVFVRDLRTSASGVFSAYTDLLFNSALVEPAATGTTSINHGEIYINATSGDTNTAGLINELGGTASSTAPLGAAQRLLAEVTMRAKAAGQITFRTESADTSGTQFLVYGLNTAIPTTALSFGTASISAGLNFTVGNDTYNFNEDSTNNSLTVLDNDTIQSGSGAVLTIQSVSTGSAGGTITVVTGGKSINYTPAANFNGSETFTYTVANQNGASAVGTVTVQVQPVNDPPVAVADSIEVTENTTENFVSVLQNDNDGPDDGETLRVTAVGSASQGGTVRIGTGSNNIIYTPRSGFRGVETFTYTIADNSGLTSTATVTVNVKPAVPPPTAVVDTFTIDEDAASAEFDVLVNDTPSQTGEVLTVTAATATSGTTSVTADQKKLVYRPAANFNGTEVVRYTLRGSLGGTTTGTVTFTVRAINDAPTPAADSLTASASDATTSLNVLANDTNVDSGETLTITAVTQPSTGNGTVSISSDGKRINYVPPSSSFSGTVTFSYTVGDGSTLTGTANVSLAVSNFVLRDIGGNLVMFDRAAENDSIADFLTLNLELKGTDFQNQVVTRSVPVVDGQFRVEDLKPGNYEIVAPALPFLTGSDSKIVINSAPTDSDSVNNTFRVGVLHARYLDIRDFLGSTIGKGLTVAVEPGKSQNWVKGEGDWTGFKNIQVTMNSAGNSLNVEATRASNNQRVRGTVPVTNSNRVETRASEGATKLMRVRLNASEVTLTPVTTTTTSTTNTNTNTNTNSSNTNSNANGEGEGEGSAMAFAPLTNQTLVNATRLDPSIPTVQNELTAHDVAMSSVAPQMQLVSEAGDYIAQSQGTQPSTSGLVDVDEVFEDLDIDLQS